MEYTEYLEKLNKLKAEFEKKKVVLRMLFIHTNNPHRVGDIVTDHIGSIMITKIGFCNEFDKPCAIYEGVSLKKGQIPKKQNIRRVYQFNLKTHK